FISFHDQLIAAKGACHHEECGLRHVEVGDHSVADLEFVRREDELVCPARLHLEAVISRYGGLQGAHGSGTHGADAFLVLQRLVDGGHSLRSDDKILGVHFMFRQVFNVDLPESAQADVQGYENHFHAIDLE